MITGFLGRFDFAQFLPGGAKCKVVSPDRLRQPANVRLFQQQTIRMVKETLEHVTKIKLLGRTLVMDSARARMSCGKSEGEYCGLFECPVCAIDETTEYMHNSLKDLCSLNRDHDAVEKGIEAMENCCATAKKEPSVLMTNDKWINSTPKLMFELIRRAMEVYGTTGKQDTEGLQRVFNNLEYLYEGLARESRTLMPKYSFEVLNENSDDTQLKIVQVQDFFDDEDQEEHLVAVSIKFKTACGVRAIPAKAQEWDGRIESAEAFTKSRPNGKDVYLVRVPNGERIDGQVMSEGLFDGEKNVYFGMQPEEVRKNNENPHLMLVPNRRSVGHRLILD